MGFSPYVDSVIFLWSAWLPRIKVRTRLIGWGKNICHISIERNLPSSELLVKSFICILSPFLTRSLGVIDKHSSLDRVLNILQLLDTKADQSLTTSLFRERAAVLLCASSVLQRFWWPTLTPSPLKCSTSSNAQKLLHFYLYLLEYFPN